MYVLFPKPKPLCFKFLSMSGDIAAANAENMVQEHAVNRNRKPFAFTLGNGGGALNPFQGTSHAHFAVAAFEAPR